MREPRDNADAEALDLEQARLILGGAPEVRDRLATDPRVLMGVWGVAWLVGYLALWFTSRPTSTASAAASEFAAPAVWAFIVFYGLLVLAVVVTIIHVTRRGPGLKGASATSGTPCKAYVLSSRPSSAASTTPAPMASSSAMRRRRPPQTDSTTTPLSVTPAIKALAPSTYH